MLHNPFYYGDFLWNETLYKGTHEPIISKDLWDKVQVMFENSDNHSNNRKKHRFVFSQLLKCGHCGYTITAESKKNHIYYHCTGHKGKHGGPWAKESEIDRQFFEAFKKLHFNDKEMAQEIMTALKETHDVEKKAHMKNITTLQREYTKFQKRLDILYEDKIDGEITAEEYQQKRSQWIKRQKEIRADIERFEEKNIYYFENANLILELAQMAAYAYREQNADNKRELIKLVLSNLEWKEGMLSYEFKEPFDIISKIKTL